MSAGPARPTGDTQGNGTAIEHALVCVCVRATCSDFGGKIDTGLGDPFTDLCAAVKELVASWQGQAAADDEREMVCRFATAADALQCTQAIQRTIAASDRPQWVGARIGCCGTCRGDAHGEGWRQAVRCAHQLAERAAPGQTIAAAHIVSDLDAPLRSAIQPLDASDWASDRTGIGFPMCLVAWQDDVPTRVGGPVLKTNLVTRVERLQLHWRGEHLVVDAHSDALTIGRSQRADITIESEYASRIHAELCYQDTCFVLTDRSTNGTYIKNDDAEIFLHDDRYILRGEGAISLGRRSATAKGRVVFFKAEPVPTTAATGGGGR